MKPFRESIWYFQITDKKGKRIVKTTKPVLVTGEDPKEIMKNDLYLSRARRQIKKGKPIKLELGEIIRWV